MPIDPSQAEKLVDSARAAIDTANDGRKGFDVSDQKINEASARILESYAALAESNPAALFGLEPTERERFLVREALRPAIDQLGRLNIDLDDGGEVSLGAGDVTGGNIAALAGISEAVKGITDVLKSPQGPEILEKIFGHIEKEKNFIKDTVKEGLETVGGMVSKVFPG